MNYLRILGIDKITPKIVIGAIFTLTLFGIAVTGLFECWKYFPLIFVPDKFTHPDFWDYFINLFPFLGFCLYCCWLYNRYKPKQDDEQLNENVEEVGGHKAVIFALSVPVIPKGVKAVDDVARIIDKINEHTNDEDNQLKELYGMRSIGQFFKILYHHKDTLKLVWPITTNDSEPYKECIRAFLDRFIKDAKICRQDNEIDCHINCHDDVKIIDGTIKLLSKIYKKENLESFGFELKKSDIIVDITGGTKTFTTGLVLGALDSGINIQYVTQINNMSKTKIISLSKITPEIILDKIAEYLKEIYVKKNEANRLK